jgi:undecaprenyl pyrophosphate synthase
MNDLSHIAFIMDGNGRWGFKKKKAEIMDISLE